MLHYDARVGRRIRAYNLCTGFQMDGGNLLFTLLSGLLEYDRAERISFVVSACVAVPLCCIGAAKLIRDGNVTLLGVSIYLAAAVFLSKKEKDSIKL